MDSREASYILAIAHHQNLTRAAQALYVGQPALSKFLKKLEQDLGAPLFYKQGTQLIPTAAGSCYLRYAKQLLTIQRTMKHELDAITHHRVGLLRVGFPVQRGAYIIPQVIPKLIQEFPGLRLHVEEGSSNTISEKLIAGELDLGFINAREQKPDLIYEHLEDISIYLAASNHSPIAHQATHCVDGRLTLTFEQIRNEKFINLGNPSFLTDLFSLYGATPDILLSTRHMQTMLQLIAENCGVGLIFPWFTQHISQNAHISVYDLETKLPPIHFYVAYHKSAVLSIYAKRTMRLVKDLL